jgi:ubiquinone biosynthesis protein
VAVKVQRAGIMRIFRADIRNLRKLTAFAQSLGVFGRLSATGMVDQFEAWTLREMDFRTEGATAERVARKAGPAVVIPEIHWDLSTARVLTMDFVTGISATHIREMVLDLHARGTGREASGLRPAHALHNFTEASLQQLFVDGFFHGDPHPGNILFLPENRVVFLDFGIFGELTDERRAIITAQIESLATGNIGASMRAYGQQVTETDLTDMDRFRDDCREVLTRWYAALLNPSGPIEDRHLARYTGEMIDVSRRNGLIYDLNYLLFWRAINNLNATLWHIDPEFDLLAQLRAFFEKTRPDAFQRVRSMVKDPAWQDSLRHLGGSLARGLGSRARRRPSWRRRPGRIGTNAAVGRMSGWAMLGIAGISAAVLGRATSLPMSLTLALVATFVVTALFTSWRLR